MKKKLVTLLKVMAVALALFIVYLIFWPVSFGIDRTVTAYRANMLAPDDVEEITVTVRGRYSFRLFRTDTFRGSIVIDGLELEVRDIRINNTWQHISYRPATGNFFGAPAGQISSGFALRNVGMIPYSRHEEYDLRFGYINMATDDNYFIAWAVRGRVNMVDRYNRMMQPMRDEHDRFLRYGGTNGYTETY